MIPGRGRDGGETVHHPVDEPVRPRPGQCAVLIALFREVVSEHRWEGSALRDCLCGWRSERSGGMVGIAHEDHLAEQLAIRFEQIGWRDPAGFLWKWQDHAGDAAARPVFAIREANDA